MPTTVRYDIMCIQQWPVNICVFALLTISLCIHMQPADQNLSPGIPACLLTCSHSEHDPLPPALHSITMCCGLHIITVMLYCQYASCLSVPNY